MGWGTDNAVTAILSARDAGFSAGMKAAAKETENLSGKVGGADRSIGKMIGAGALLQVGMKAVDATMRMVTSHVGDAVKRFDTMNNYPRVMANLDVGAKASERSIKQLSKGIEGLPTTLDSAALGVQRFTAANGNIKKSTKYFLAMNDAIVAGGAPTELQAAAVEQLSQSYAKGKMDMMEWRSISAAMPGQLKQVASAMGMTKEELGEGLRTGKVSMDDFMDTLVRLDKKGTGKFKSLKDQARAATDGIGTAMTNLHTAVTRGMANAMMAIDDALEKNNLPTMGEMINAVGDKIGNLGNVVSNAIGKIDLAGIVKSATPYWNLFKSALSVAGNVIKTVGGFLLEHAGTIAKVIPYVIGLGVAFKAYGVIRSFIPGLKSMSQIFGKLAGGVLAKLAPQLFATGAGEQAAGAGAKTSAKPMMQMGAAIMMIGAGVALAAAGIWLLVNAATKLASAGWPAVGALAGLVAILVGVAVAASVFSGPLIAAGVALGIFGAGLAVTGVAVMAFAAAFAIAKNAIVAVIGTLSAAFTSVVNTITGAVLRLAPVVISVMNSISGIITSVGVAISTVLNAIAGVFNSIGVAALNAGRGFVLVASGIRSLVRLPIADLGATLAVVASGLKKVANAGSGLAAAGSGMMIIGRATRLISSGGASAATSMSRLKTVASSVGATMKSAAAGAKSSMNSISAAAKTMMAKTKSALSKTSWARACGVHIGSGFAAGIRSKVPAAMAAANSLAAAAEKAARAKAKIKSPSRVFIALGQFVGEGFAIGMDHMKRDVNQAAQSLVSIPSLFTPQLAMDAGSMSISDGYSFEGDNTFNITVVSEMDGKEVARTTARYTKEEIDKMESRNDRLKGRR